MRTCSFRNDPTGPFKSCGWSIEYHVMIASGYSVLPYLRLELLLMISPGIRYPIINSLEYSLAVPLSACCPWFSRPFSLRNLISNRHKSADASSDIGHLLQVTIVRIPALRSLQKCILASRKIADLVWLGCKYPHQRRRTEADSCSNQN